MASIRLSLLKVICPLRFVVPIFVVPVILAFPSTCNFSDGVSVFIPTLPLGLRLILSLLSLFTTILNTVCSPETAAYSKYALSPYPPPGSFTPIYNLLLAYKSLVI